MTPATGNDASLSKEEVLAAIRSLPEAAWIRLRKVAAALCRPRPDSAEDLLQEAFTKAIDGSRKCPSKVDTVLFLIGVMRSLASDAAKLAQRHPELRAVSIFGEDGQLAVDRTDASPSPEQRAMSAEVCTRFVYKVLELFADDPVAQVLVEGMMDEMEGEELRKLTDLDRVAFASKLRLIDRRIKKAFPEGWKP